MPEIGERLVDEIIDLLRIIDQLFRDDYSSVTTEGTTQWKEWKTCDKRLAEIGEELYKKGGEELMRKVYDRAYQKGRMLRDAQIQPGRS